MIEMTLLASSKRPNTRCSRIVPHLYPAEARDHPRSRKEPIVTHLHFVSQHTKTVRYRPDGDDGSWETGEPYIPTQLTFHSAERLTLTVNWQK
jgi:hypothetical protein